MTQLFGLILALGVVMTIFVIVMTGVVVISALAADGTFDRFKRFIRRQPKVCPDCGSYTVWQRIPGPPRFRRHTWRCSMIPNYSSQFHGCHKLYMAKLGSWAGSLSTSFQPMFFNAQGMCDVHPTINLDCRMCQYILEQRGIVIE